jgi:CheY-like chemotaxis protein
VHTGELLGLLEQLCTHWEFCRADSVEQAARLLEEGDFDLVVAGADVFRALDNATVCGQAIAILDTIAEGVCIVSPEGTIRWANRKIERLAPEVRAYVAEQSRQAYEYFEQLVQRQGESLREGLASRRFSHSDGEGRYFEMVARPMLDGQGHLTHVATVVAEATASRRLQQRIDAIDHAGRELARLDAEMLAGRTVEQRITLVQEKIIRYARDLLHFDHFVVRVLKSSTNKLEVLFGVGIPEDQPEIFANSEGNGISGYVAATGRSYICYRTDTDPHYLAGLAGARSSLTVPLRLYDRVIGTLNVESHHEGNFSEDDRQVAEIFGRYIAIALNVLDLLVVERYHTTGQATASLCSQVAEPLNRIMTEISLLQEDYIGHDDLRHRLRSVIDNIDFIKTSLKEMQSGPRGILNVHAGKPATLDEELSGKQILVVDDEDFIRQTIAAVLQKQGCLADTAVDGREALALLGQREYDLVISDIKLPYHDGYEIFAASADRGAAVILMTGFGYDPNHSIVRANREGLSAVLYKPFKTDQLLGAIRKALRSTAE